MNGSSIDTLPLFESLASTSEVALDSVRPSFNDEIKAFDQFGQQSVEVWEGNIRYLINEYLDVGSAQGTFNPRS